MLDVPNELIKAAEKILVECPHPFSYDIVYVPSKNLQMVEGGKMKDDSWIGIVIYEDDITRYAEPERVTIGLYLRNARNIFRSAGFRCEFYPLSGKRGDHSIDPGLPTL